MKLSATGSYCSGGILDTKFPFSLKERLSFQDCSHMHAKNEFPTFFCIVRSKKLVVEMAKHQKILLLSYVVGFIFYPNYSRKSEMSELKASGAPNAYKNV